MKGKLEELQTKRDQLVARSKTAEAQNTVQDAIKSIDVMDPTSEVSRFEEKVRREEAKVAGKAELAASSLDAQFEELEGDSTQRRDRGAPVRAQGRRRTAAIVAVGRVIPVKLTESFSYNGADVESVYALISDQAFRTESCANQGATDYDVTVEADGDGATVTLLRTQEADMPDFVKKLTGSTVKVKQTEVWSGPDARRQPYGRRQGQHHRSARRDGRQGQAQGLERRDRVHPQRRRQGVDPVHRQEDRARGRQGDHRVAARRGRVRDGEALAEDSTPCAAISAPARSGARRRSLAWRTTRGRRVPSRSTWNEATSSSVTSSVAVDIGRRDDRAVLGRLLERGELVLLVLGLGAERRSADALTRGQLLQQVGVESDVDPHRQSFCSVAGGHAGRGCGAVSIVSTSSSSASSMHWASTSTSGTASRSPTMPKNTLLV